MAELKLLPQIADVSRKLQQNTTRDGINEQVRGFSSGGSRNRRGHFVGNVGLHQEQVRSRNRAAVHSSFSSDPAFSAKPHRIANIDGTVLSSPSRIMKRMTIDSK